MSEEPLHPLRKWRLGQQPRMTLDAAAAGVGTFRSVWYDWEIGRRKPDDRFIQRLYRFTMGAIDANTFHFPNGFPDLDTSELHLEGPAPLFDRPCESEAGSVELPQFQDAA